MRSRGLGDGAEQHPAAHRAAFSPQVGPTHTPTRGQRALQPLPWRSLQPSDSLRGTLPASPLPTQDLVRNRICHPWGQTLRGPGGGKPSFTPERGPLLPQLTGGSPCSCPTSCLLSLGFLPPSPTSGLHLDS